MKYQFTLKSSNAKTGPIPTSMTERDSCPMTCPLRGNGCYAENFPLSLHWGRVADTGISNIELGHKLMALPVGQLWRHNVAGDLPAVDGKLDLNELDPVLNAVRNRGLRTILYTHHKGVDLSALRYYGINVNVSCETVQDARAALDSGLNAVMVVPIGAPRNEKRGDVNLVACPAQYRDEVTCASCGMCAVNRVGQRVVVTFEAHGAKRRSVNGVVS